MHTCKINDLEIIYPAKWDELNRQQLNTIVAGFSLGLTNLEFKIKTALSFLNLKVDQRKPTYRSPDILHSLKAKKGKQYWISNQQLLAIGNSLNYLTSQVNNKEGIDVDVLNSHLTINLIPSFRHRLIKYYGPTEKLFNLVFDEYLEADNHFMEFSTSGNIQSLNKLVATLYRPQQKNYKPNSIASRGDCRQIFNSHTVKHRAKKLSKLSIETKYAVLLYYQGSRKFLAKNFPHVFSSTSKNITGGFGPLGLIDALTGDDVTKNKAVRQSYLYDVMVRLERAAINQEETQKQIDKQKHK